MTKGVGGSHADKELEALLSRRDLVTPISPQERQARVARAQALMREQGINALYLDASTSLYYFTGIRFGRSERLHGAILPANGEITLLVPAFEEAKVRASIPTGSPQSSCPIAVWEEHENPTQLVVHHLGLESGAVVAVDETTPFFTFDGLRQAAPEIQWVNGSRITAACRMHKSANELSLIQCAMDITLQVQRATARILRRGITTTEVADFIAKAHKRMGIDGALSFVIVLFGEPTAYPHGVPYPQTLRDGDMVLIDTGATIEGYQSDITRSYVFGTPSTKQREIWNLEKAAQAAAFQAAQIGAPCGSVDDAARAVISAAGLGPDYQVPGLPHRTGHGIGLDGHEWPYLVKGNPLPLQPGMCFSNEPMICLYGEFGVRLEDHFYMTESGPKWFTQPSHSIDDPFAGV